MHKRFASIWFPFLVADWMMRQRPELKAEAFILYSRERGRMVVKSANRLAHKQGISTEMVVADCRAIFPDLTVLEYPEGKEEQLLKLLAEWSTRFTPLTATDQPNGIILDCSGCSHLWGGEELYLNHILKRFEAFGYHARGAISDTAASAWAFSHFGKRQNVIPAGEQLNALLDFPPESLRLEPATTDKLRKLGLNRIKNFASIPPTALTKRFGSSLVLRLDQVSGFETEVFKPIKPTPVYLERLPCLEPICTAKGIEIAIERLLDKLCDKLESEGKGMRKAVLKCYRVDGDLQAVSIGTNLPTRSKPHLRKLFELKIGQLQPDLGFELFELYAPVAEEIAVDQIAFWSEKEQRDTAAVAELLDKIIGKRGESVVQRYFPAEHYWPERSFKNAASIRDKKETEWRTDLPRPVHLLKRPEKIAVTVREPDYPPLLFRYKGEIHPVKRADGPERIEQEWWLQQGKFRDYYCVEDEKGARYWLFRSGPFDGDQPDWFIHGFFA